MRKIILLLVLAFFPLTSIQGVDLQARAACLFLQHKTFRTVYGTNAAEFELEASASLEDFLDCDCNWSENSDLCNWSCWTNLSYYRKKGHSSYFKNSTHVTNWSLNLGLKRYFCYIYKIRPYLGLGIGASYARFKDHSIYVQQELNMWGFSLLAKSGIEYEITPCLFIDLFADYSYNRLRNHSECSTRRSRSTNLGGFKIGLGLGWRI